MVSLTGELLTHAESLLRMGLHISDIIIGYEKAGAKAIELLKGMLAHFNSFLVLNSSIQGR